MSEFVNSHVKKVSFKYNTILYHSHSPIKAALAKRMIRTIRLSISKYYTLKNTAAFSQDLDKIMLINNQRPYQSFFNHSPPEVHHSNNIHDIFPKQYSNEKIVTKKINVGDIIRINRTTIFEKGNYERSTELIKE